MSVSLLIRLQHSLPLVDLQEAASAELHDLLNLVGQVVVETKFDESDAIGNRGGESLTSDSSSVLCSLVGHEEEVAVTPFVVPVEVQPGSFADQCYVSVRWHFNRGPLCSALQAAVALAVAEREESEIEDNSGYFIMRNCAKPNDFRCSLRLNSQNADLQAAANMFWAKLPRSAEIVRWLESRE